MRDERLEYARNRYEQESQLLQGFKTNIELSAKLALAARAIEATVHGRVKSLESVLKKLILKQQHTYDSLPDKVGVRVISNDRDEARSVIRDRFHCIREEDKAEGRAPDQLGYPGVHFDVQLRSDDPDAGEYADRGLRCEIQVRTYAEHSWCEVSRRFDYKTGVEGEIPAPLKRRLMLTIGLLEMADMTLSDVAKGMNALPAFVINRAIDSLERVYFRLTARPPDREISFEAMTTLLPLYEGGLEEVESRVEALFAEKKNVLRQVFERNEKLEYPRAALFFQPESLIVYDLLRRKQEALREAWKNRFPEDELIRLANEFGYTFDDL